MSEITLIIKPIMFEEIKKEITIKINPDLTPIDLIFEINKKEGNLGSNLNFLFRGKKLLFDKSLKSQNITKDNLKILMNRTKDPQFFISNQTDNHITSNNEKKNSINIIENNSIPTQEIEIEKAKKFLLEKIQR